MDKAKPVWLIIPNDNWKEREDKFGHVRTSKRRTWIVCRDGEIISEHKKRREAMEACK